MKRFLVGAAVAVASLSFVFETDADACGGCFAPGETPTVVSDHRMILSISKDKSTLYDQIKYSGSPASFGWVLPIAGTAEVGLSSDLLFATLDQQTQVRILPPPLNCPPPPPGCFSSSSGGSSAGSANAAPAPEDDGVQVLKNEVVGPYETVQLASDDANALNAWLAKNGYSVPQDVQPVIAAYVAEKFNFLALKLVPGQGVQSMRPVRVTTTGAGAVLPLRMVAAGTGATVGIGLWVVAEGRYEPQNFASFFLDEKELAWDWARSQSNYVELRAKKTAEGNGRIWEIESSIVTYRQTIASIVEGQTVPGQDYLPVKDANGNVTKTSSEVREEDLTALFAGATSQTGLVRLTRMRADLAHAALDADLQMTASATQAELPLTRQLTREVNEPSCPVWDGCSQTGSAPRTEAIARSTPGPSSAGSSCAMAPSSGTSTFMVAGLGIAALAVSQAVRRRRR
jgi:hypothetical protein